MNTAQYIPQDCVAPIIFRSESPDSYRFFSGTGFFVKFPPYDQVFFVTGKHCVLDQRNEQIGFLEIKLNDLPSCNKAIPFKELLTTQISENESDFEDVVVYVLDKINEEDFVKLTKRALPLPHQETTEFILQTLIEKSRKVRTIGFPSISKEMDYDKNQATIQPRGIVGTVTAITPDNRWITVESLNWKDGGLEGFSGSPILEFVPGTSGEIKAIPIGVLLTGGGGSVFRFLSINVVTNLIASYIVRSTETTANPSFNTDWRDKAAPAG